jgi:hypothetical protein
MNPRLTLITDAAQIAAIMRAGKYREHLPWWTRDGNGLWVEKIRPEIDKDGKRL